ncbi:MAG: hypothetical protein HDR55_03325 [Treponema sp.]|nr:hypothetical protein [Treponema sp.]MBD5406328.1 hypothetical protein [Treponema sp.]
MKNFIFGVISAAIIGVWILLVYVGIISIKTAILVPLCLGGGIFVGILIMCYLLRP